MYIYIYIIPHISLTIYIYIILYNPLLSHMIPIQIAFFFLIGGHPMSQTWSDPGDPDRSAFSEALGASHEPCANGLEIKEALEMGKFAQEMATKLSG